MAAQTHAGGLLAPALTAELAEACASALAAAPPNEVKLLALFARAGRTLGATQLELTDAQRTGLQPLGFRAGARAGRAQLARTFLLVEACAALAPAQHLPFLLRCYRTSGNEERVALLR